jgi:hypothetical protein
MPENQNSATPLPYDVPEWYGGVAAVDSFSNVAAPLLAGGALAVSGVVLQAQSAFRFPGTVLLLLLAAFFLLVTAVQCGMWARRYAATPEDIGQWWPDLTSTVRQQQLVREQWQDAADHRLWAKRAGFSFNGGILLLWAGLACVAVPPSGVSQPTWRWGSVMVACLGVLTEVAWMVLAHQSRRGRGSRRSRWFYGAEVTPPQSTASTTKG